MSEESEKTKAGAVAPVLRRWQSATLPAIVVGVVGMALGYKTFWSSYLYAFLFWLGITLGCCTITFLHHSIRAHWTLAVLRIAEAGNKNIPLMALLFFFIAAGAFFGHNVYPWIRPEVYSHLHLNKQIWYTPWFWAVRAFGYFVFWYFTTNWLNRSSARQDEARDEALASARASRAAPWGVIHVLLLTLAFTDWLMSLDPNWFSTLYGAWHMTSEVLATIALGTFLILTLKDRKPYDGIVTPVLTKDLGNMMLGFTMIWGYFTLSQFLIIWSGNLPEEIAFFVSRFRGAGVFLGAFIVIGQFFGPFLALIAGRTKRTYDLLRFVAGWIFVVRMIDMWWQVIPFVRHDPFALPGPLVDLAALVGIGGIWTLSFLNNLRKLDVLPAHDMRLQEAKVKLEAHSHA